MLRAVTGGALETCLRQVDRGAGSTPRVVVRSAFATQRDGVHAKLAKRFGYEKVRKREERLSESRVWSGEESVSARRCDSTLRYEAQVCDGGGRRIRDCHGAEALLDV